MPVFEQMKERSVEIEALLQELLSYNNDELYGEERLHQLSFNNHGRSSFEMVFGLLEDLAICNLERVPVNLLDGIKAQLLQFKSIVGRAQALTLDDTNPKGVRDQLVVQLENSYQNLFNSMFQVINFANKSGTDFKQIERDVRQVLVDTRAYAESVKLDLDAKAKDAGQVLESMRLASAEAGVSQNSIHYAEAEKRHKGAADRWYGWSKNLLIALAAFVVVVSVTFGFFKGGEKLQFGYFEAATTLITALWIWAIRFCVKNYYAEKHNETINENKARTLATFRSFVDATDNDGVKDRILVQAGMAAFTMPQSGYIRSEPELPLPMSGLIGKSMIEGLSGQHGNA